MSIEDECICCQEVGPASEKKDDAHLQCITDHEGFIGNCLNRHVIEVSLYAFVKRDGPIDDNEPINEWVNLYTCSCNFFEHVLHCTLSG